MKKILGLVIVLAAAASIGCNHTVQANGPHGPEFFQSEGTFGGSKVYIGGPVYNDCMKAVSSDVTMTPRMRLLFCRRLMPGGGSGAGSDLGPDVQMMTPYQSGLSDYPGSAATVSGPTPTVIAPSTGGSTGAGTSSGGPYATKEDVKTVGSATVKNGKDICKINKSLGKPCK